MPKVLSRKEQKQYFKRQRKRIYEEEYNKALAKSLRGHRQKRVEEIQAKARRDANLRSLGGKARFVAGVRGFQGKVEGFNKKRVEIGKKLQPYVDNLNKQLDMSSMYKKKRK